MMQQVIKFTIDEIHPERERVLNQIGVPPKAEISEKVESTLQKSLELFDQLAQPVGKLKEISVDEFKNIFAGEGNNEDDAVLGQIYDKANKLTMFALTLGEGLSAKIENLFSENEFPLASMLDAAASVAADNAVTKIENDFNGFTGDDVVPDDSVVLGYSPGYCGWNISGQKKFFEYMNPGEIGITLNDSFLMTPVKSVTGVMVEGEKEIHIFENKFKYCRACKDKTCRERIKNLLNK